MATVRSNDKTALMVVDAGGCDAGMRERAQTIANGGTTVERARVQVPVISGAA